MNRRSLLLAAGAAALPTIVSHTVASSVALPATVDLAMKDIYFQPAQISIPADTDVTIRLINQGFASHQFRIDSPEIDSGPVPSRTTTIVKLNLPPGSYNFRCPLPGHTEAGMTGTLTAVAADPPATPPISPTGAAVQFVEQFFTNHDDTAIERFLATDLQTGQITAKPGRDGVGEALAMIRSQFAGVFLSPTYSIEATAEQADLVFLRGQISGDSSTGLPPATFFIQFQFAAGTIVAAWWLFDLEPVRDSG